MGCNIPRPWKRPPTPIYEPPEMPKTAPVKKNNQRTNCPNCCAVITGPVCEYCGTRFEEYEERVIPIYINNQQVDEVVKPLSLPIKEQR